MTDSEAKHCGSAISRRRSFRIAEPVQYVANIYKYYIAYSLSFEQMARRSAARERAGMK